MRVLKFVVDNLTIRPDPDCDFSGLFPGKEDHIQVDFTFSPEWRHRVKVAAFWSIMDKEYPPQVINRDGTCDIPTEALSKVAFKIQVLGKHMDKKFETNKCTIYQSGSSM